MTNMNGGRFKLALGESSNINEAKLIQRAIDITNNRRNLSILFSELTWLLSNAIKQLTAQVYK